LKGLYVIIVLGESIVALLTDSYNNEISLRTMVSAGLGLLIAFSLKWLYFDVQGLPKRQHALQREVQYAELWTFLHWPLTMAITATGAGVICLIEIASIYEDTSISGYGDTTATNCTSTELSPSELEVFKYSSQWMFCASLAITIFCIALHGLLSKEHSQKLIPHNIRVFMRVVVAAVILCSPLFSINSINMLVLAGILCVSCASWELIGTLPSHEREEYKDEELSSIGNFIQNKRMGLPINPSGTVVVNATMKDGTLVFNEERIPMTVRKGLF